MNECAQCGGKESACGMVVVVIEVLRRKIIGGRFDRKSIRIRLHAGIRPVPKKKMHQVARVAGDAELQDETLDCPVDDLVLEEIPVFHQLHEPFVPAQHVPQFRLSAFFHMPSFCDIGGTAPLVIFHRAHYRHNCCFHVTSIRPHVYASNNATSIRPLF